MKWSATVGNTRYEISEEEYKNIMNGDRSFHYAIFRYEDGQLTHDYLQDDLETAMEFSQERFGVPIDAWKKTG